MRSVASQSILPEKWVIVDDGSTDRTAEIVKDYETRCDFITLVSRPQSSDEAKVKDRLVIAAPPRAFNYGLKYLKDERFDFIVKLDGDLSFDNDYFERLFKEFDKNPQLGMASGIARFPSKKGFWTSWIPEDHALGASKIYRKECFQDIGGIEEVLGWDTIDELKAQLAGWDSKSFRDIVLTHWRLMGSSAGIIRGKVRHGFTNYYLGYHPVYMLARVARRSTEKPYIIGSLAMLWGYIKGYIWRYEQIEATDIKEYLRKQQLKALKILARNALIKHTLRDYRATQP
ncbi:MAG: glycosyltransferase family 2 protein [Actinobacteria bacterium]|nr:glycosyltransferase family 2 protein [Actinomycetota bacterium]